MEIKNIDELIEKLLNAKSITVSKIQKIFGVGYSRATQVLDDKTFGIDACYFDENGELDKSKLDACFVDALRVVVNEQKASVAFLQRKLQIGYSRAARIIDMMEDLDFISGCTTIPRIVFITKEEFEQIFEKAC